MALSRQTGTHVAGQLHRQPLLSIFGKRPGRPGMLPAWACHAEDIMIREHSGEGRG
ncbi:C4-dicarboxylate transporter DctA, partial [Pseudomonas syringae]